MAHVIDANVAVALTVALPYSQSALRRFDAWVRESAELYAPLLWEYEVVSALRRMTTLGILPPAAAESALGGLLSLPVERVPPEPGIHRAALQWADRLGHSVAYDAQYLALAERLGATLWTADKRLVGRAQQLDARWVRWIADDDL